MAKSVRVRVLSNDLPRLQRQIAAKAEQVVGQVSEQIASEWRAGVPRQSGSYASSIGVDRQGTRATVSADAVRTSGANAPYAYPVAVEYGNIRTPATPAATPAAERGRPRLADGMRRLL